MYREKQLVLSLRRMRHSGIQCTDMSANRKKIIHNPKEEDVVFSAMDGTVRLRECRVCFAIQPAGGVAASWTRAQLGGRQAGRQAVSSVLMS